MGAGRKPKPEADRRSELVSVKLTRAERAGLEEAAGPKPLSVYLRDLILRHLARRRR